MKKLGITLLAVLLAAVLLAGCDSVPSPLKILETEPPVEQIAMVVTEQDLETLDQTYPALKEADFRGSTCYDAIERYIAAHPGVAVQYTVSIGGREVQPNETSLVLDHGSYDYGTLRTNLQYLHNVHSVYFRNTNLQLDAVNALREAYPAMDIDYSLEFCGMVFEGSAEELDFSGMDPQQIIAQGAKLALFPKLRDIYLMTEDGQTNFTLETAAELQTFVPEALLHFSFTLFDKQVSTTDEEVSYAAKPIGRKEGAEETLRMALSIMRGCKRFVLDNCQFSNDTLFNIRNEFRDTTKVVWRVWFGKDGGCLTDRKIIYYIYGLYDSNCSNLIYCEDAEFIDFGHNEYLRTCDFVTYMTKLKAIILSGSMVADLSPFANCESLEFLELAFCGYLEDISPLAYCTNLKRLNIAFTKVSDLSPLDNLTMDVMVDARSNTSPEERMRFDSLHADCIVQHSGDAKDDQPYGYPWRYEKNGDPNPYYQILKEKFNYPHPENTRW